ncbi:MAG: thioesterase family protein [Hyphomicrobiales bacterium]
MTRVETARNYVNTWECDENDHLNVQSYFGHFDAADAHFRAITGLDATLLGPRAQRHVRYMRELRVGEILNVRSYRASDAPYSLAIAHELFETATGELSATAIDVYWPSHHPAVIDAYTASIDGRALPRGLPVELPALMASEKALLERGGEVSHRGLVGPGDCDWQGRMTERQMIGRFSDAAGHAWEQAGLTRAWLQENGCGRVAVELRLAMRSAPRPGDLIHIVTQVVDLGSTAFVLRHAVFDSRTKAIVATGEVVSLVMDLDARKAVRLPEDRLRLLRAKVDATTA